METALIYAGIPLAVIAVVVSIVFAGGGRRGKRYRPGRPFEFRPVWFVSAPERVMAGATGEHKPLAGHEPAAIGSSDAPVALRSAAERDRAGDAAGEPARQGTTGGASDRW